MGTALVQALRDLEAGRWSRIYLVAGEEPFQAGEFVERVRKHFIKSTETGSFNYDIFDADQVTGPDLLACLDTLPGLFDAPDAIRLVICRRFEKASAPLLESLLPYFQNPSPHTCFLILAEKVDRRKAWLREMEKHGCVLEVVEPYDRDWPRWRPFFERRCGKAIEPAAWEQLVEGAAKTLSLVSAECDKAALYVGDRKTIQVDDVRSVSAAVVADDIFQLSEEIVAGRGMAAMLKLHRLLQVGESEIKILSILVRHFRQIDKCLILLQTGIHDSKIIGPQIGVPPFFVPKILELARNYTPESITRVLHSLAECDYHLKRGEGTLWADFLVGHFSGKNG